MLLQTFGCCRCSSLVHKHNVSVWSGNETGYDYVTRNVGVWSGNETGYDYVTPNTTSSALSVDPAVEFWE